MLEESRPDDVGAIVQLMNRAYRGDATGWATETGYIGGERTSEALLADERTAEPDGRLLVTRAPSGAITGCVWLAPEGAETWHLGSLTIDPALQKNGAGHRLLEAAEAWIAARGGRTVRMSVIHLRDALIAWYQRRGYQPTGETKPFPYGDTRFGIPQRADLHFIVLEKRLDG